MIERENDFIKEFIYRKNDNEIYFIYIRDFNECYECYLQNADYGTISLMFGLPKTQQDLTKVIDIINNNLEEEINCYKLDYEDKE